VRCRVRTFGITETVFQSGGHEMSMVDVSGQRTQPRKWIHYFQDVTSILYLASLSGYNLYLNGNKHAVRVVHGQNKRYSWSFYRIRCKMPWQFLIQSVAPNGSRRRQLWVDAKYDKSLVLKDCPQIIFLNKNDLFQEKILRSDLKTFFPVCPQLPSL